MKLHNTLTKKIEDFTPAGEIVKLYTCGPTVYHYAHIGNLRNVVFNDTLRRILQVSGLQVNHVMNITDVGHLVSDADEGEDKLEKGAARDGKTVWEVADFYIAAFRQHTTALNVLSPSRVTRATDAIPAQVEIIRLLIEKEFAYISKQAIYFDVSKLDDYGKLSGQKLADKEIGARGEVVVDRGKRNPQDFALWFFTVGHYKNHQMHWDSPWGDGFPGWHLECSAIIHQELGETIDIHTGGVDHIGTHHTNEIAQSEAAFGKPLARFWLHNEFLHQDGGKMSKSGAETITLDDVVKRGYDPLALRLFYLQSHYRSEANFSWENLEAANSRLIKWRAFADLRFQPMRAEVDPPGFDKILFDEVRRSVTSQLANDLNTPEAITWLDSLSDSIQYVRPHRLPVFTATLQHFDNVLGLDLLGTEDISDAQKQLIAERENERAKARQNEDWTLVNSLKDRLLEQGIGLRDTEHGTVWHRL